MSIQYCTKRYREQDGKTYYMNIFGHIKTVQACIERHEKIYEIDVSEVIKTDVNEIDENLYYGWLEYLESGENGRILYIYPVLSLVDICFAYGYKAEENIGKGRLIRVKIEEKREVERV